MTREPQASPGVSVSWLSPARFSLLLVAVGATLFGTEWLLRRPLLEVMSVSSIVLAE